MFAIIGINTLQFRTGKPLLNHYLHNLCFGYNITLFHR